MEVTIRNTTPQMVPVLFDNGDEYELQSETIVTFVCEPEAEIVFQENRIEAHGLASPLDNDESNDEEDTNIAT